VRSDRGGALAIATTHLPWCKEWGLERGDCHEHQNRDRNIPYETIMLRDHEAVEAHHPTPYELWADSLLPADDLKALEARRRSFKNGLREMVAYLKRTRVV
jgi:hypothetical protein